MLAFPKKNHTQNPSYYPSPHEKPQTNNQGEIKSHCTAVGPLTENNFHQVCLTWKAEGKQAPFLAFAVPSLCSFSSWNWLS